MAQHRVWKDEDGDTWYEELGTGRAYMSGEARENTVFMEEIAKRFGPIYLVQGPDPGWSSFVWYREIARVWKDKHGDTWHEVGGEGKAYLESEDESDMIPLTTIACHHGPLILVSGSEPEGANFDWSREADIKDYGFITKDSGKRAEFESGMVRDTAEGKPRYDLLLPEDESREESMLYRFAMLMARGAEKYGDNNWQKANSSEELQRMKSSAMRHFMQWMAGEEDEDHAAAVFANIMFFEHTKRKLTNR